MYAKMLCVAYIYITRCALVFPFSSILKSDGTNPNKKKKLNSFPVVYRKGWILGERVNCGRYSFVRWCLFAAPRSHIYRMCWCSSIKYPFLRKAYIETTIWNEGFFLSVLKGWGLSFIEIVIFSIWIWRVIQLTTLRRGIVLTM